MKISNIKLLFVLVSLIASNACSSTSKSPEAADKLEKMRAEQKKSDEEKNRAPIELTAKKVEDFPAPSDAETIPESPDEKKPARSRKTLKLKSAAAVYDVAHFYRREMTNTGWKDERPDETNREDPRSILAFLTFSKENEEVDININTDANDGSEIEIVVSEKRESRRNSRTAPVRKSPVPMPPCAEGSNLIFDSNGTTITADCEETLKSVADFYLEEMPKEEWRLNNKTGGKDSDETMILTFTKENRRAIVSLVRNDSRSTSVNVRVSK